MIVCWKDALAGNDDSSSRSSSHHTRHAIIGIYVFTLFDIIAKAIQAEWMIRVRSSNGVSNATRDTCSIPMYVAEHRHRLCARVKGESARRAAANDATGNRKKNYVVTIKQ